MPLREERVLQMIQATMFKVTEDVSCCTDKCMQALEALFWRDVVHTVEYQIQYCFEFSALNLSVKMSNETQFSIMEFIY